MFSTLWESTKFTCSLFFRIGYAISLIFVALFDWLKLFPLIDKWVFKYIFPRIGLLLLGSLVTPLPIWILVLLMFVPPGLYMIVIFFSFMGALIHIHF